MPRRSGITKKQLDEWLENPYYKRHPEIAARVQADLTRSAKPLKKRDESAALGGKIKSKTGMVNLPCKVHCRILRIIGKGAKLYDDDNYIGGLKECRDAVTAALGFKGDSEEDGITFEYIQEIDREQQTHIEVEIYESS